MGRAQRARPLKGDGSSALNPLATGSWESSCGLLTSCLIGRSLPLRRGIDKGNPRVDELANRVEKSRFQSKAAFQAAGSRAIQPATRLLIGQSGQFHRIPK